MSKLGIREKEIPKDTFGYRLREARKKAGYSQTDLAYLILMTPMAIHNLETSKSLPSIDALCRICVVLDISADELLKDEMASCSRILKLSKKCREEAV